MLSVKKLLYKMLGFLSTESYPMTHSGMQISITRRSGAVSIDISSISSLAAGNTVIGVLPEGWRPPTTLYLPVAMPTQVPNLRLGVAPSGSVSIYNYSSAITTASNYTIHFVFLAV